MASLRLLKKKDGGCDRKPPTICEALNRHNDEAQRCIVLLARLHRAWGTLDLLLRMIVFAPKKHLQLLMEYRIID